MIRLNSVFPLLALVLLGRPALAQARPRAAKPAGKPAVKTPAKPTPTAPVTVTPANLAATLQAAGYATVKEGDYQRLRVDEEHFGYLVDLSFSKSGEWLVCMAHLAPIPDLTKVPASPMLALLSTNDSLLGMAFSYDRAGGQIMLNASVPARGLTPAALKNSVERLKAAVREYQGLWDPAKW